MKFKKAILFTVLVGATALAVGCSTTVPAAPVAEVPTTQPVTTAPVKSTQLVQTPETMADPVVEIGYEVGKHVPNFEITSDDGRKLTSEDILSEGKPVFLFFTASW